MALEAAARLAGLVLRERSSHVARERPTVDRPGTYSWCDGCDAPWPCRWVELIEAASTFTAALTRKVVPS